MTVARSVADVVAEHVRFELACIDRMYCNVYVPRLQYAGGVLAFLKHHLHMQVVTLSRAALPAIGSQSSR